MPIAKKNKCILIYPRPKNLSHDNSISLHALQHAAKQIISKGYDFDIYGFLQITEPLRPDFILDKCIKKLKKNKKINSAFAGFTFKKFFGYTKIQILKKYRQFWKALFQGKREKLFIERIVEFHLPQEKMFY